MIKVNAKKCISDLDKIINGLDAAIDDALLTMAELCAEYAAHEAPVRTGALRASIEPVEAFGGYFVRAGAKHAPYVEFGTSRMAAQPYMEPAGQRMNVNAQKVVERSLRRLWR